MEGKKPIFALGKVHRRRSRILFVKEELTLLYGIWSFPL